MGTYGPGSLLPVSVVLVNLVEWNQFHGMESISWNRNLLDHLQQLQVGGLIEIMLEEVGGLSFDQDVVKGVVSLIERAGHSGRPAGTHLLPMHFVGDCNAEGLTSPRNER
jgi:hypothetical protein